MVILVRPPTDAQPMAEMPQWLINPPRGMMEDGANSDSSPETGTGGFRGLWYELSLRLVPGAGRAGRAGEVCDHESLDGTRVVNSLFRVAETIAAWGGGGFPRLLPAGPRLTRSCAARDGSEAPKNGGKPACRGMIGRRGGDGDGRTTASCWCCTHATSVVPLLRDHEAFMTASRALESSEWFKKFSAVTINMCGRRVELHHGQTEELMLPETSYPMLSDQLEITLRA
ncbi:hypothetical protein B0J13DRAFT_273456 [Dactylonectria estremocensis]|uniref:Uncharacterized protein n=1 Tax=Dactylonectria estremocensis TaxID=1079267 RepID=A0A9P9D1J9_9HYPO|nr:hypothetical protein B0J13DRAFT_273456 [Dactylonectria estremocensis]